MNKKKKITIKKPKKYKANFFSESAVVSKDMLDYLLKYRPFKKDKP